MTKPLIYDVFCGAGGAAKGYMHAGFRVVGIDHKPQPRYCGDEFIQMDAFEFFKRYMNEEFEETATFHCSPPCQAYSVMNNLPWLRGREYPLLILPTLEMLEALGKPYVLENVMGARYGAKGLSRRGLEAHGLKAGWLCGAAFGKPFYRHRLFATNWPWLSPGHPKHQFRIRPGHSLAGRAREFVFSTAEDARGAQSWPGRRELPAGSSLTLWQGNVGSGQVKGWRLAADAMGIDWMKRSELTQAIPPCYTMWLGSQLLRYLEVANDYVTA